MAACRTFLTLQQPASNTKLLGLTARARPSLHEVVTKGSLKRKSVSLRCLPKGNGGGPDVDLGDLNSEDIQVWLPESPTIPNSAHALIATLAVTWDLPFGGELTPKSVTEKLVLGSISFFFTRYVVQAGWTRLADSLGLLPSWDKLVQNDIDRAQLTAEEARSLDEGLALDNETGTERTFQAYFTEGVPGAKAMSLLDIEAEKKGLKVTFRKYERYLQALENLRRGFESKHARKVAVRMLQKKQA
ncbi:hypothetical protein WJX73_010659 [Symbiochloris irregularis]|uniref:Uncharacterized protein n=1 Tax=Symbiochloris irregularis TaxID=706552 RepID=A0AAW1PN10_9CHLO